MKIVFGSDHAGFPLKEVLRKHAEEQGYEGVDVGVYSPERADYPTYGRKAAEVLAAGEADRAVVVCGTGVGISLAANSVKGVRCVVCSEEYTARLARAHNDANALAVGARVIGDGTAIAIFDTWINEPFQGGRHAERVALLKAMES